MTAYIPTTKIQTFAVYDGLKPVEQPRVAKVVCEFDTDGRAVISLNDPNVALSFVQGVFCANDSAATVTITHRATGIGVIILPRTQGWYDLITTEDMTFDVVTTLPAVSETFVFSNSKNDCAVFPSLAAPSPLQDGSNRLRVALAVDDRSANSFNYTRLNLAGTTPTLVRVGTRSLFVADIFNGSAVPVYLKLFNKNAAPVPGTDTPVLQFMCPAGQTRHINLGPTGAYFSTGLGMALTAGNALLDATGLMTANEVGVSMIYT